MPTTLTDHLQARLLPLQARASALQAALATARGAAQTQGAAVQAARQALHDAEAALRSLREQLAAVALPAAGSPLLLAMQQALITRTESAAALLAAEETLLGMHNAIARQQDELDDSQRRIQGLQDQRARAQAPHAARQALLGRLAGARLPVQDDAAARLALEAAAAEAQLKQDFPTALLNRLSSRHQHLTDLAARMQATLQALAQLEAGVVPAMRQAAGARQQAAADAAGAALADDAAAAVSAAVVVLAQLAARPPRLNAAEKAALAAAPAATADMSTRSAAAGKQADFDSKQLALAVKDGERRAIHLQLQLADPEDFPPAAGARKTAYDDALAALATAQAEFDAADSAYTAKHRRAMNDWLANVGDALAADLDRFLAARQTLRAVDSADPAALRDAITGAETALVDAQRAAEAAQQRPVLAAAEVQALRRWLQGDPGADGRRLHQGLRGAP